MSKWIRDGWSQLLGWFGRNWLSHHLAFIPIGTWGATWLLLDLTGAESDWWANWTALQNAGQVAPFGAAVYGAFILPLEIGVRTMFWAIQQALNRDAKIRQDRDKELLETVRTKGVVVLDGVRLVADPPRMGGGVSVTNPQAPDDPFEVSDEAFQQVVNPSRKPAAPD